MNDHRKTKDQLIAEVEALRQRVADLVGAAAQPIDHSEQRFRSFFDQSLVGIGATSADRRWLDVNDTLCQMLGYSRDELLNLTWAELTHPDDIDRSASGLQQLVSGDVTTLSFEKRYVRKDGQIITAQVRARGVYDSQGRFEYAVVNLQDISARKQAEQALRDSEARANLIYQSSSDAMFLLAVEPGPVYRCLSVNTTYLKTIGLTAMQLIDRTTDEILPPSAAQFAIERYAEAIRVRHPIRYEETVDLGQGVMTGETTLSPIFDAAGRCTHILGAWRDITERKRMDQALRESEQRHRLLADNAADVIWTMDLTGRFTYVSPSVERLRGYTVEEVLQQTIDQALTPDSAAIATARLTEAIQQVLVGQTFPPARFQLEQPCKDGRTVWTEVTTSGMYDEAGQFIGILGVTRDIAARKQAEAALRASEERYRLLADDAPLAVAVIDVASAAIVYANQQALQVFELSLEQALGSSAIDRYVNPADRAELLNRLQRDGHVSDFIAPLKTHTGRVRWMSITSNLTTFENRPAIHSLYVDVTDRLRAEAAEREQRKLAEALRDTAAALNSTLKFDEVLDRILTSVERVIQYDAADILLLDGDRATAWLARHHSHYEPELTAARLQIRLPLAQARNLREMLTTGEPFIVDDTHADPGWIKHPATTWIRSNLGLPIRIQDETIGFLSIDSARPGSYVLADAERLRTFADQAAAAIQNAQLHEQVQRHAARLEQRVAERTAELERERARLQGILDTVDEALYFVNLDGTIQYANATTSRITGYSFDEMLGRRPHDLWRTSATRKAIHAELDRVFVEGTSVYGVEVVNRHKNGALYHAQLSVAALRDAEGQVMGFAVAQRDMTRLKELEHLKSQFTSRIGHELRTPLTSLMIYLDLLEHGKPEKRDKYLHTLHHEADRLRRLIEGFLRMSEVDAAGEPPDLMALSLNEIVSGMLLKHRARAASRHIEIEPQLDPALPLVWAEAAALTEAVERVLDNAVNYTPDDGHIAVTTLAQTDGAQRWIGVSIVDSGPGFSPTDQLHLFERFYRGDAARDYKTAGAGLSLAICHGLMQRLNGRLLVENAVGQGAAVSLWLMSAA